MAEIFNDHIKCDKTDPWLKIRIPARLLYWVDEAAEVRGISTEELVNELLYDYYGKRQNTKGEYRVLNPVERKQRRQLTVNRYVARTNIMSRQGIKQLTPAFEGDLDWQAYEVLRAANLKLLEEQDFETRRRIAKHRTAAEVEALNVALSAKGIERNFIRIGDQKLWTRAKSQRKKHGHILKTQPKSPRGVKGFKPADVKESDALIQVIKDSAREVGAMDTVRRIEDLELAARAERLKLKNPTV